MKKNQHYVWKYYLKAWADKNNRIACMIDGKPKVTNIDNLACERYFYELTKPKFGDYDLMKIILDIDKYDSDKKAYFHLIFDTFTKVFQAQKEYEMNGNLTPEADRKFIKVIRELDEEFNSIIEGMGKQFIMSFRGQSGLALNLEQKATFYLFLCTQYMRTKRTREKIINTPDLDNEFRDFLGRTWSIVKHCFALNLAETLFLDRKSVV